ncbi:MAG: ABC transporter ATP-binding protein [Coriobacteriales bacterium]|nr:ABC transporter ATP-binding protein [Coriobacteriales bacterium]
MANLYSGAGGGAGTMAVVRGDSGDNQHDPNVAENEDVARYSAPEVLRRLMAYVRPHRMLLILAFVCSAISVILQLYVPILIGRGIDAIAASVSEGANLMFRLMPVLMEMFFVVPLAAGLQWLSGFATNRLSYETVRDLRQDASDAFLRLPFSYLDSHSHGDLLSRVVNDADAVGDGLLQGFTQLFSGIVTILGTLVFMFSLSVPVGLVVVLLTPLSVLVAMLIARASSWSFADAQRLQGNLSGYANEMISNQQLVSAFARGDDCAREFGDINADLYVAGDRSQFVSSLANPSTRLVNNITYAVVAVVGSACVINGWPSALTIGQVQSFLSYANQYMKPFNEVSGVVTQLQAAFASARRLLVLLDSPQEFDDEATQMLRLPASGAIKFSRVNFAYEPDRPILRDVSFVVRPGERYALVGPTGCGKTTLINLLLRFYDCDEGSIYVDGLDTSTLAKENLRQAFGMVLQDTWLRTGTIRENIAYGCPHATNAQIQAAAEKAHAHKFIVQLPQGYDTVIGEESTTLSQGQRQLICIARVMLANPSILLLDEATSSIDTRTELQVQDAFDRMLQGRTSLVVAHRLSTIRNATCILVMDGGRIVERGSHEELLERGGFYARLYRSQWETTQE